MILIGVGLNLSYRPELPHRPANAVYFWKTTFDPDSAEIKFIKEHAVKRVYMRMFDIVANRGAAPPEERVVPNDTLRFPAIEDESLWQTHHSLADAAYVTTVYLTVNALRLLADSIAQ